MNIPEINEVKSHLDELKTNGVITDWELPYENILTRRSAAIFFVSASNMEEVSNELTKYDHFSYRDNTEKRLSQLSFRITFSEEEKEKNQSLTTTAQ